MHASLYRRFQIVFLLMFSSVRLGRSTGLEPGCRSLPGLPFYWNARVWCKYIHTMFGMLLLILARKKPRYIPANFFWDISVRFLSWQCREFWTRHDHFRRFPKKSEVFRRSPKTSEVFRSLSTGINASSLPVLFPWKIRDRGEGHLFILHMVFVPYMGLS